jgi:hypothetical protein
MNRNAYIALACLATMGLEFAGARKGPRARIMRHTGRHLSRAEYKDAASDLTDTLKQIQASIATIGDRLKKTEDAVLEHKSLDGELKGLKADLTQAKKDLAFDLKAAPELKAMDERFTAVKTQLDTVERKINEAVQNAAPGKAGKKGRKSFAEVKSLDAAMRNQQEVELKGLDSDLKQQDIFLDGEPSLEYPLLNLVFRRPTSSDRPRYSYYTGTVIRRKGKQGSTQTQGERKKVLFDVATYDYQPTIEQEDVQDVGARMLDDEMNTFVIQTPAALNEDLVDSIQTAVKPKVTVGFNEFADVASIPTAASTGYTNDDLNNLIAELPRKYWAGAVFMANKSLTASLMGIKDSTGRSMWQPTLQQGVPPTLKGYTFIQDDNLADGRLVFTNPRWGLAIMERQTATLTNVERLNGDYRPYYMARYGQGVTDPRGTKVMDLKGPSAS